MRYHIYLVVILTVLFTSCETEEPIPSYTLSTTAMPAEGGKITISPASQTYKEGTIVTLIPEANEHWLFQKWEGDGIGNSDNLQITMNSNKSVVGVFVKKDYLLSITKEGQGTVMEKIITNPSGKEYPHGTTVQLTPIPDDGWVFDSWEGDLSGNETPTTIKVDNPKNVKVKFKRRDYPLHLTIEGGGTVKEEIITDPSGKQYPFETLIKLTTIPNEGWEFGWWGGDLSGTEPSQTVTVNKEKNIVARFQPIGGNLLSAKLDKTVWVGDENYQPCDCGFSGIIGFDGFKIYELGDFGSKEPTGCYPYNFYYRDYDGEIKNIQVNETKISFNIISAPWDWYTEIELIDEKLKITSSTTYTSGNSFSWVQEYSKSQVNFLEFCK